MIRQQWWDRNAPLFTHIITTGTHWLRRKKIRQRKKYAVGAYSTHGTRYVQDVRRKNKKRHTAQYIYKMRDETNRQRVAVATPQTTWNRRVQTRKRATILSTQRLHETILRATTSAAPPCINHTMYGSVVAVSESPVSTGCSRWAGLRSFVHCVVYALRMFVSFVF